MKFKRAQDVSEVVWEMWQADWDRSENRTRINSLFNGDPPYTDREARDNNINTNVNFLEPTKIAADARRQFENAMLKTGTFFTIRGDKAPKHKKNAWSRIVTNRINKVMKNSLPYLELQRQVFAQLILHGVGPKQWLDRQKWLPQFIGIDDFLVPSGTNVDLSNLDRFAIFRRYTPGELYKYIEGPTVGRGWNMEAVNAILKNLTTNHTLYPQWPNYQWPEKLQEDFKENSGFLTSDAVPTVDCWDFFYLDDEGVYQRKMILDTVTSPGMDVPDVMRKPSAPDRTKYPKEFLFESREGYGSIGNCIHIQFADGANVAPFRYHSVRSLGFMLYAVCHLQNRLRCRFNDAVFESMNWYFREVAAEDREKLEMINLTNMGIIPQGLNFVLPNERHILNEPLLSAAFQMNKQLMSDHSAAYVQNDQGLQSQKEETATAVMARVNTAAAMVGGMLQRAYSYQKFEDMEICRRFCIADSKDPDVKKVREQCRLDGVRDDFFDIESWEVDHDRVSGGGMKTLEIAIAKELLGLRPILDPEPQRIVTRDFILATSDDPQKAEELVPENPIKVTDAVHDAEESMGALLQGVEVKLKTGMNHLEYVNEMLGQLDRMTKGIEKAGGMTTPDKIGGFMMVLAHIKEHIAVIAQDKNEKQIVKTFMDVWGQCANLVKAFSQRIQEQAQNNQGQQGLPPEVMAKVQAMVITAQAKANIDQRKAAAKEQRDQQKHLMNLAHKQEDHNVELLQKEQDMQLKARHSLFTSSAEE